MFPNNLPSEFQQVADLIAQQVPKVRDLFRYAPRVGHDRRREGPRDRHTKGEGAKVADGRDGHGKCVRHLAPGHLRRVGRVR